MFDWFEFQLFVQTPSISQEQLEDKSVQAGGSRISWTCLPQVLEFEQCFELHLHFLISIWSGSEVSSTRCSRHVQRTMQVPVSPSMIVMHRAILICSQQSWHKCWIQHASLIQVNEWETSDSLCQARFLRLKGWEHIELRSSLRGLLWTKQMDFEMGVLHFTGGLKQFVVASHQPTCKVLWYLDY